MTSINNVPVSSQLLGHQVRRDKGGGGRGRHQRVTSQLLMYHYPEPHGARERVELLFSSGIWVKRDIDCGHISTR